MPRYEKQGARGVDYVDLHIDGTQVRTHTGCIGGKKKPSVKEATYRTNRAAESRFARAIASAKAKGFVHVSTLRKPAENPELERAIAERPDDASLRVAYGDWLRERGDARGELIAVQREQPVVVERERAVLAAHSSLLYGTLDELLQVEGQRPTVRVQWKLGFFDEVELRLSEGGMPWFPKHPELFSDKMGATPTSEIKRTACAHVSG
jgi:uncharacterized protein (TIGR02996 family)